MKIIPTILIGIVSMSFGPVTPFNSPNNIPNIRPFDDTPYIILSDTKRRLQPGVITGKFGDPRNHSQGGFGYPHQGIDYKLPKGYTVRASADGVVEFAGDAGKYGYGWTVVIDHGNGLKTRYAHLSRQWANQGDRVLQGQRIGEVGDSGNARGYHLHYEIMRNGKQISPSEFIFI